MIFLYGMMSLVNHPIKQESYINRGLSLWPALKKFAQAIADFSKVIEINPGDEEAYNYRGGVYNAMGHFTQAVLDYNTAIKINPATRIRLLQPGHFLCSTQRPLPSQGMTTAKAIKLRPNLMPMRYQHNWRHY